ncbi:hypothetical protein BDZ85DRAFT_260333 [Elsinoe ampelina]|uniref:WKF domain-containing protein n=1 Tax=Elsinoe ampelina TaxID=302913 RepID=A0A6A6GE85_9PEZI|nr:hypothetical protein BDZ85DRAFT_260333 [Elsinoe ampelina]
MSATPDSARVPAWKRLGLKLKNPQAQSQPSVVNTTQSSLQASTPAQDSPTTTNGNSHLKKSSSHEVLSMNGHESGSKKRKRQSESTSILSHASLPPDTTTTADYSIKPSHKQPNDERSNESQPRKKRSKSVTFSQDTKPEDGDSTKLFGAPSTDPEPITNGEVAISNQNQAEFPAEASEKKPKERKARNKDKLATLPTYVQYLEQFHADRANWKFNKSKQNDILKNIWNTYRIPPSHNNALVAYIKGLQGQAARKRISDEAKARLHKIMPTAEERAAWDRRALHRRLHAKGVDATDEEIDEVYANLNQAQIDELVRIERVLREALEEELGLNEPEANGKSTTRKARKSRTTAEDSASSSESSSESSDETTSSEESSSEEDDSDDDSDSSGSTSEGEEA